MEQCIWKDLFYHLSVQPWPSKGKKEGEKKDEINKGHSGEEHTQFEDSKSWEQTRRGDFIDLKVASQRCWIGHLGFMASRIEHNSTKRKGR